MASYENHGGRRGAGSHFELSDLTLPSLEVGVERRQERDEQGHNPQTNRCFRKRQYAFPERVGGGKTQSQQGGAADEESFRPALVLHSPEHGHVTDQNEDHPDSHERQQPDWPQQRHHLIAPGKRAALIGNKAERSVHVPENDPPQQALGAARQDHGSSDRQQCPHQQREPENVDHNSYSKHGCRLSVLHSGLLPLQASLASARSEMASRKTYRITTGMGRRLHLDEKSNRYAVVVAALAGLGTLFWRLSTTGSDAWFWAFRVLVGVFLAWAISRELDPDEPASAVVAPLVVLPFLILGPPSIAGVGAGLIAARVLVRTTGLSPSWFDGVLLVGGAAYLGARPENWPILGALIVAVLADRLLYPSGPDRSIVTGGLMSVAAVIGAIAWANAPAWESPTVGEWIGAAIALGGIAAAIVMVRPPTSRGDYRKEQLTEGRILGARVMTGLVLILGLLYPGGPTVPALSPLWAGVVAIPTAAWARRHVLKPMALSAAQPVRHH